MAFAKAPSQIRLEKQPRGHLGRAALSPLPKRRHFSEVRRVGHATICAALKSISGRVGTNLRSQAARNGLAAHEQGALCGAIRAARFVRKPRADYAASGVVIGVLCVGLEHPLQARPSTQAVEPPRAEMGRSTHWAFARAASHLKELD